MDTAKITKLEKSLSVASLIIAIAAFACIMFVQNIALTAISFVTLFLLLITIEVIIPFIKVKEIFIREKKLIAFPVVYLIIYIIPLITTVSHYLNRDDKFLTPLIMMIIILIMQIVMPMYQCVKMVVMKNPDLFPLYYSELKAKHDRIYGIYSDARLNNYAVSPDTENESAASASPSSEEGSVSSDGSQEAKTANDESSSSI